MYLHYLKNKYFCKKIKKFQVKSEDEKPDFEFSKDHLINISCLMLKCRLAPYPLVNMELLLRWFVLRPVVGIISKSKNHHMI